MKTTIATQITPQGLLVPRSALGEWLERGVEAVKEEVVSEVEMEENEDEKVSLTDKIKGILTRMFEIEDQKIS